MKKRTYCSCIILLFTTALSAQKEGENLFEPSVLHEIRFESNHPDLFALMLGDWQNNPDSPPYQLCNVRIDGQFVDSVGARIKGGLSAFNQKRPLKIDFNTFVETRSYDGLKKINLLNADFDRPMMRDMLGYAIFRQAGIKSPRTSYARVFINDVYHGVYVVAEQVDKTFLNNRFADDEGILYKNKTCFIEVESGENTLTYFEEMNQIAAQLSGTAFVAAIEKVLDTDAFLRFFLVEHFINAADNPMDVDCNYYVYRIPSLEKLYWIPWDLNYGFYPGLNYGLYETGANGVFTRMMDTPQYRERYTELACEMLQYLFKEEQLHPIIDQATQLIRDEVADDPRYDYSIADFDQGVLAIKDFVSQRRQDFMEELAATGHSCPELSPPVPIQTLVINEFVASSNETGGIADPQGQFPDWIELYNKSGVTVPLSQYYLSNHKNCLKHWRFPEETEIAPYGYLIVWADRDIVDEGLHADFKLDKEGGSIYLSFENLNITDSVTYTLQSTNIASARLPNGSGPFILQAATFSADNGMSSADAGLTPVPAISIQPNPASEVIELTTAGLTGKTYRFVLIDLLGQVRLTQSAGEDRNLFHVGHLPAGHYFVIVEVDGQRYQQRIILTR